MSTKKKVFSSVKKLVRCGNSRHQVEYGIGCGFELIPKRSRCTELYGDIMGSVFDCMSFAKTVYTRRRILLYGREFFNALANMDIGNSENDILDSIGFAMYLSPCVHEGFSRKYDSYSYMKNVSTIFDKFMYFAERLPVIGAWNIICSLCDEYFSPFFPHVVYEFGGDLSLFWDGDVYGSYWANKNTILSSMSDLVSRINNSKFTDVVVEYDNFPSVTVRGNIFHVLANLLFSSSSVVLLNRTTGCSTAGSVFGFTILYLLGYHDVLEYIFKHHKNIYSMPRGHQVSKKHDYVPYLVDFIFGSPRKECIPYLFKLAVSFVARYRNCKFCLSNFIDAVISRATSVGGDYAKLLMDDIFASYIPRRTFVCYDSDAIHRYGASYINEPSASSLLSFITSAKNKYTQDCYHHSLNNNRSGNIRDTYRYLSVCYGYRVALHILSNLSLDDIIDSYGLDSSLDWIALSRGCGPDSIESCWNALFSPFQHCYDDRDVKDDIETHPSKIDDKTPECAVKMLCDAGMYRYASVLRYCARKVGFYDTSKMDKYLIRNNDSVLYGCLLNYIFEVVRRCHLHETVSFRMSSFKDGYIRNIGGFYGSCLQVSGF